MARRLAGWGSRCWTTAKAVPALVGRCCNNSIAASNPPADPPMPTIGQADSAAVPVDALRRSPFRFDFEAPRTVFFFFFDFEAIAFTQVSDAGSVLQHSIRGCRFIRTRRFPTDRGSDFD